MNDNLEYKEYVEDNTLRLSAIYIAIVMALIPLFNLNVGGRGLFLYLGIGIVVTLLTIRRYTIIFEARLWYLVFALYEIITLIWGPNVTGNSVYQCLKTILYVLLISFAIFSKRELKYIYYLQIVMGVIITIILCTTTSTMVAEGEYLTDTERSILVIGDVQIDPNYASILLIPVACFLCKMLLKRDNKFILSFLSLTGLGAIVFALLKSGSRGGLIAVAASVLFYYIRYKGNGYKKVFIPVIVAVFIAFGLPYMLLLLPESVANRFQLSALLSSGGSGRLELWIEILKGLFSSPFALIFGHGYGAALNYLGIASHNYFLDIAYNCGIIGFLILILMYSKMFKVANANKNVFVQAILFGYIVMSCTVSVGSNMYFWTGITLVILLGEHEEIELKETREIVE